VEIDTVGARRGYYRVISGFETLATPQWNELRLSDSDKRAEFVSRARKVKPLPAKEHARLQRRLLVLLTQFLRQVVDGKPFLNGIIAWGGANDIRIYVPDIAVVLGEQDNSLYANRASDIILLPREWAQELFIRPDLQRPIPSGLWDPNSGSLRWYRLEALR
jgi:Uma2 family endonuclease